MSVGRRRVLGQRAKGLLAIRPGVFEFTNESDVVVWGKKKKKLVGLAMALKKGPLFKSEG